MQGDPNLWEDQVDSLYYFGPMDYLADEDYEGLAYHHCIDNALLDALLYDGLACFLTSFPKRELLGYEERMVVLLCCTLRH